MFSFSRFRPDFDDVNDITKEEDDDENENENENEESVVVGNVFVSAFVCIFCF